MGSFLCPLRAMLFLCWYSWSLDQYSCTKGGVNPVLGSPGPHKFQQLQKCYFPWPSDWNCNYISGESWYRTSQHEELPGSNPLLKAKGEIWPPVRSDTLLRNWLIFVGCTCSAAGTSWFLKLIFEGSWLFPHISNFYSDWHQAPFAWCIIPE